MRVSWRVCRVEGFCVESEFRWPCRGWSQSVCGVGSLPKKMVLLSQPQASLRYDSRCSFLEMVFIASSGGLGVKARRWNSAACLNLWEMCEKSCSLFPASTTRRRKKEISTVRRPATFFPGRHWPPEGIFARERASIRCLQKCMDAQQKFQALCWVVNIPTQVCIKIIQCSTVRTFRGVLQQRRRHWNSIRHWHLIVFLRMTSSGATEACSMRWRRMLSRCVGQSVPRISASSTNISTACEMWSCELSGPVDSVKFRAGDRRLKNPTCHDLQMEFRRILPTTCG